MFGNLSSALGGSSGTALRPQPPSLGTPNAPGNAQPFGLTAMQPSPMSQQQTQQGIGNIGPLQPPGGVSKPAQQNQQNIQQIMASLHPQATAALRAMPRDTMTHLVQAGLMHPGVMQHLYGNNGQAR